MALSLNEIKEKVNTLPNGLRELYQQAIRDIVAADESVISKYLAEGEITMQQYQTWKECVRANVDLLLR